MTEHSDSSRNDLSKLEDTYEILSTLQEDRASATYLARHKELGRDVTITIVHMPDGGANNTLTHFASDARLLSSARHETIVPVIEGRWLDDDTFAVVRVLARGTTLTETLATSGPFSQERAAETLEQVSQGLQWARESGVVHRTVASDSVGFQQGSGRVMMSLGLSPLPIDSLPDACTDAQTIGALAWSMLTGRSYDSATTDDRTLGDLRPRLSSKIVAATEALLACKRGSDAPDIREYINLLKTEREATLVTPRTPTPVEAEPVFATAMPRPKALPAPAAVANASERTVVMTSGPTRTPVGATANTDVPVVVRSRFRTPIAAALVMVALTVVAVLAVLRAQGRDIRTMVASGEIDRASIMGGARQSPMEAPPPALPAGSALPPSAPVDTPPPPLYPNQIPGTTAPKQPTIPTLVLPYSQLPQPQPNTPPIPTSSTGAPPGTPPVPTSPTAPPVPSATGALPNTPPVPTSPTAPPVPTSSRGALPTTPPVPTSPTAPPVPTSSMTPPTQPAVSQPAVVQPTVPQSPAPAFTQPPVRQGIDSVIVKRADTTASESRSTYRCSSSNQDDQQACFSAAKARNDTEVNRVFGDVIARMRRRANVGDSDPDPETVRELRAAQRRWVDERDAECRRRGAGAEGAQWAQSRAQCFAEFAAERARALVQIRDSVP